MRCNPSNDASRDATLRRKMIWKTKWNFFTAYGERQLGPTHKERIDKRRRDPFINRKRGEPQEQVTETQSEGKTRFYPTHSHEFRGQTGKRNTNRRRDGSGKQKLATDAQPPYRERQVTSASEIDESETLQCKNFHAQRQRALNKMPQIRKGDC